MPITVADLKPEHIGQRATFTWAGDHGQQSLTAHIDNISYDLAEVMTDWGGQALKIHTRVAVEIGGHIFDSDDHVSIELHGLITENTDNETQIWSGERDKR